MWTVYSRFVAWGRSQAIAAHEASIREAVRTSYAQQLASAGLFRRLYLHFLMRQEVRRELDRVAPPDGLYFAGSRGPRHNGAS